MSAKAKTRYGLHSVSGFCLQEKAKVTWILQEETFLLQKFKKTEKISCKIA